MAVEPCITDCRKIMDCAVDTSTERVPNSGYTSGFYTPTVQEALLARLVGAVGNVANVLLDILRTIDRTRS